MKDWAQKLEQWDAFNGEDVTVDYSVTFSKTSDLKDLKVNERDLAKPENYNTFAKEALEQAGVGLGYVLQQDWDTGTIDNWLNSVDEAMHTAQSKVTEGGGNNALTSLINGAIGDISSAMQGDFSSTTSSKAGQGSFLKNGVTWPRRQMTSNISGFASGDKGSAAATDGNLPYGETKIPAWRLKDFKDIEAGVDTAIDGKLIPPKKEASKSEETKEQKIENPKGPAIPTKASDIKSFIDSSKTYGDTKDVYRVGSEGAFYRVYEDVTLADKGRTKVEEKDYPASVITQEFTSDKADHKTTADNGEWVGAVPSTSSYGENIYQDRMSYMLNHYLSGAKVNNISLSDIKNTANAMMETTHPLDGCNWLLMTQDSAGNFRAINFRFKTMVIPDNTRGSADTYYGDQVVTIPINNTTYEPVFKSNFLIDRKLESLKKLMDSFGYRKDLTNKDENIEAIYDLNALNSWKPIKYEKAVLLIVPGWFFHDSFKVASEDGNIERLDTLWNNTKNPMTKNKAVAPKDTNTYPAYVFQGLTIQSFKMDLNFDSSKKEGWEVELTMSYKDVDMVPQSKPNMQALCKVADGIYDEKNGSVLNIVTQE